MMSHNNRLQNYNDLRPVNILPALLKLLKKLLYLELYDYMINKKIIPDNQSRFRKGFSTTTIA